MKGSQIAAELPEKRSGYSSAIPCGEVREQMILDHVKELHYVVNWVPVTVDHGPFRATFYVTNEALRLGDEEDSFRPSVNACTQQRIADHLGATLLTPKLLDMIWRQADIRVDPPVTLGSKVPMTTTSRMVYHHNAVEARIAKMAAAQYGEEVDRSDLLIANVGKHWVNDRALLQRKTKHGAPQAINYGWWISSKYAKGYPSTVPVTRPAGTNIWQTPGGAHNILHQDYSQVVRLVARIVKLCGPSDVSGFGSVDFCDEGESCELPDGSDGVAKCVDIYELAQDEKLWPLLSHNGPVYMRQESVPWEPGAQSLWSGFNLAPPANRILGEQPPVQPPSSGLHPGHKLLLAGAGLAIGYAAMEGARRRFGWKI